MRKPLMELNERFWFWFFRYRVSVYIKVEMLKGLLNFFLAGGI